MYKGFCYSIIDRVMGARFLLVLRGALTSPSANLFVSTTHGGKTNILILFLYLLIVIWPPAPIYWTYLASKPSTKK